MAELILEVTGMHCSSCGLLIDDAVEEIVGVTGSSTNIRTHLTTVQTADAAPDPGEIVAVIARAGYGARLVVD